MAIIENKKQTNDETIFYYLVHSVSTALGDNLYLNAILMVCPLGSISENCHSMIASGLFSLQ